MHSSLLRVYTLIFRVVPISLCTLIINLFHMCTHPYCAVSSGVVWLLIRSIPMLHALIRQLHSIVCCVHIIVTRTWLSGDQRCVWAVCCCPQRDVENLLQLLIMVGSSPDHVPIMNGNMSSLVLDLQTSRSQWPPFEPEPLGIYVYETKYLWFQCYWKQTLSVM